ncbi:dynactin subunit 4 [Lipomyces oligophaga]|uniref:dynactin subunit 4 n=1 Tax=Lipomyces oligophaga TaxID=45792 RepID=UPI0034CD54F2
MAISMADMTDCSSLHQIHAQIVNSNSDQMTSTRNLLPLPVRLRTRRSKRCRACRHILVRPEVSQSQSKRGTSTSHSETSLSTSYRINLLLRNYVPSIRLTYIPVGGLNVSNPYTNGFLAPLTYTFALTFFNPHFDSVHITLATFPETANYNHMVTLLTPSFDIGGNSEDDWDREAVVELRKQFEKVRLGTTTLSSTSESTTSIFARGLCLSE